MAELGNTLFYIAVPVLFLYFFAFNKTIKMLEPVERDRYIKEAGSRISLIVTIGLFVAFFYLEEFQYKLWCAGFIVMFLIFETLRHHRKLKALKFSLVFEKRLLNISYLSGAGIVLILASAVLNANAT